MKSTKNILTLALVAAGVTAVSLAAARPAQGVTVKCCGREIFRRLIS